MSKEKMSKEKTIYELELHESTGGDNYRITRVPGGWVYQIQSWEELSMAMTFVPYNNEFE